MAMQFELEAAIKVLQSDQDLTGKFGALTPLIKQLTEMSLKAELGHHLANKETQNRKMAPLARL